MIAAELVDFSVTYDTGIRAVDGINLRLQEGACLALIGESGSGKSTIGRALLDLLPTNATTSGTVRIAGRGLADINMAERRRHRGRSLGYVPQDPFAACNPLRSVRHHIEESWRAHGEPAPTDVIGARLQSLGIEDATRRMQLRPHQWSGGMLQRAVIVAATAHDPVLTVADEPTSALDADSALAVLSDLRARCRALLLISHDLDLVRDHADEVAIVAHGRIVEHGSVQQIFAHPRHTVTRGMLESLERRYGVLGACGR
jgi:peptide/nickel transport system ATP-binding protein